MVFVVLGVIVPPPLPVVEEVGGLDVPVDDAEPGGDVADEACGAAPPVDVLQGGQQVGHVLLHLLLLRGRHQVHEPGRLGHHQHQHQHLQCWM